MRTAPKSEWTSVSCHGERSQKTILSWFAPFCDDMTPEKAEVLCDIVTNREKKLRVLMVGHDGKRRWAIRTLGGKNVTMTLKPVRT